MSSWKQKHGRRGPPSVMLDNNLLIQQYRAESSEDTTGRTPYSTLIQKYINDGRQFAPSQLNSNRSPIFDSVQVEPNQRPMDDDSINSDESADPRAKALQAREVQRLKHKQNAQLVARLLLIILAAFVSKQTYRKRAAPMVARYKESGFSSLFKDDYSKLPRPTFVYEHPYVTSSYYHSTTSMKTLVDMQNNQVDPKRDRASDKERGITSRLAILRPFCEFDAEALPTTFSCWNSLVPCRAAEMDLGEDEEIDEWEIFDMSINGTGRRLEKDDEENWECDASYTNANGTSWLKGIANAASNLFKKCRRKKGYFDDVPADGLRTTSADLFLFYSQTFSDNAVAMDAVDKIMNEFFSPGGWSRCFDNIYAVEANIPKELDLYIPSAQEELYSWYEAGFRIIQSGEWGDYDGFYLMEGDSVPVKNYWLDVILGEIKAYKPFAVLGAQYDGDKWDAFYEDIPISLLHHTNGNGIYNTSHPLLERLTGQLEVEAPCPYNSIPYDYRMSQMWVEGTLGIVPELAPKIMLNEEGQNITLSDNLNMFSKWANRWKDEQPYRFTKAIHNYAATNLIPRHLGPEYVIHGAKLYSPWDPARTEITLVISEWFFDRSLNLIKNLDNKDHPFSRVIIMVPPSISNAHDYSLYTSVPVDVQFRDSADFMDLCSAEVDTEWFMITNSYHQVSRHVDLMFTPGKFVPVVPFTPATYPFCLKYPYCKEIIMLSHRWHPKFKQVVLDMDMLYKTKERNDFCGEWIDRNGESGELLYSKYQPKRWDLRNGKIIGPKGPTGTDYLAYLTREKKQGMYKMTDRSLYGARAPFVKVYRKEEKLDGMSEDELARRLGMTLMSNQTDCSCDRFETEEECLGSGLGCQWRPLFESCHPPEMIDDGEPICSTTDPPTMSPTISIDRMLADTEAPTSASMEAKMPEDPGKVSDVNDGGILFSLFKTREHDIDDDDGFSDEEDPADGRRNLRVLDINSTFLSTFDPISLPDNLKNPAASSLLETLSRGEVSSVVNASSSCPTLGPSIVPRHVDHPALNEDYFDAQKELARANGTSALVFDQVRPGKARFTQHQLVHIGSRAADLGVDSIVLPPENEIKKRRILVNYDDKRGGLRIVFDSSSLTSMLKKMGSDFSSMDDFLPANTRITVLKDVVFPSIASVWSRVLEVKQPAHSIFPSDSSCGSTSIPAEHVAHGVADADVVIYVESRPDCEIESNPELTICHFDQDMRPLIGMLRVCLGDILLVNGKVSEMETARNVATFSQLIGRFLGLSPKLFRFFRNPGTNQLWGEREVNLECLDDEKRVRLKMPLSNIIQERSERENELFYEISTPSVMQIVRNHFDCQTLTGARLEKPSIDPHDGRKCNFNNLDLRYHFDEDMTTISQNADAAHGVSPLSIALLEDSSWYRAIFEASRTPSFGRAAGCGFVGSKCISSGNVPDYSLDYFCSTVDPPGTRSGCDYLHQNKAGCDLEMDINPPETYMYFTDDPSFGSAYSDVDYCPMKTKYLQSCTGRSKSVTALAGETYGESSKCYETDAGIPVCLDTVCNAESKTLSFSVRGSLFHCSYHGQVINVESGYSIKCPRIAAVCPGLVCPSNCSGKGICDYCKEIPECICDNPFDETDGCWES